MRFSGFLINNVTKFHSNHTPNFPRTIYYKNFLLPETQCYRGTVEATLLYVHFTPVKGQSRALLWTLCNLISSYPAKTIHLRDRDINQSGSALNCADRARFFTIDARTHQITSRARMSMGSSERETMV